VGNKINDSNHIKNTFDNWEVKPSQDVWFGIEQQLDFDALAARKRNQKVVVGSTMAIAAMVLLAVILTPKQNSGLQKYQPITLQKSYNKPSKNTNNQLVKEENNTLIQQEEISFSTILSPNSGTSVSNENISIEPNSEILAKNADIRMPAYETTFNLDNFVVANNTPSLDESGIESIDDTDNRLTQSENFTTEISNLTDKENEHFNAVSSTESEHLINSLTPDLTLIDKSDLTVKGFYLGATGGYNATTLVSNAPIISSYQDGVNHFRFAPSKGISVGYIFNEHLSVQADYIYNTVEGTAISSESTSDSRYFNVSLYMDQIPVLVKFKQPTRLPFTNKNASLNLLGGLQMNMLRNYQLPQQRRYELLEETVVFRNSSISLITGLEYEVFVLPEWLISFGLDATVSQNLSTFDDPLSVYPKHSITAGLRGGLYYFLGRD